MKDSTSGSSNENIKKIGELIAGIKIAMLTTIGEDGRLYSRPMATQQVEFDGDLYFFTEDDSPKAIQLARDTRVNVAYSNPDRQDYVSITGRAQIIHDRAKMEELWKPIYKAWFPQELETPGICLLKVDAESAEYWDSPAGVVATTLALIRSTVSGQQGKIGENETVTLGS